MLVYQYPKLERHEREDGQNKLIRLDLAKQTVKKAHHVQNDRAASLVQTFRGVARTFKDACSLRRSSRKPNN